MKLRNSIAGIALAAAATSAPAALISSSNGLLQLDDYDTPYVPVSPINDVIPAGSYHIGGNLYATQTVNLTYTYLGHEAAWNNDFDSYGQDLNNKSNSVGDQFSVSNVMAGLLDFSFFSNKAGSGPGVKNGENMGTNEDQSFAVILDYTLNNVFYDAIVLFDDSGANVNDDHDDHVIGIQAVSVPEPATLALMGVGLVGLAFARRRQS